MYAFYGVQESLEGERTQYSLPDGSSLEVMHDGSMFTSFMAQWEESIALVPRRGSWGQSNPEIMHIADKCPAMRYTY